MKRLLFIICLSIFFRFYNLLNLQYWSFDEDIMTLVVRKIVTEHKPLLVSPNSTLDLSLGPFFHWLTAGIFFISNNDPLKIMAFGSILGVITTILIYKVGRDMGGKTVGLIAALLYASSSYLALYDRRWWPLSLDHLLTALAVWSVFNMAKGRLQYSIFLVLAASLAWHADPTLMVIPLAAAICFFVFRFPLYSRKYIPAIIYLLVSVLPIFLFEMRHPGAVSSPLIQILQRFTKPADGNLAIVFANPLYIFDQLVRFLYVRGIPAAEEYFFLQGRPPMDLALPLRLLTGVLLFLPVYFWRIKKSAFGAQFKVLYIFLAAFLIGIYFVNLLFKFSAEPRLFIVISPVVILLAAFSFNFLFRSRVSVLAKVCLAALVLLNFRSIITMKLRYPMWQKIEVANNLIGQLSPGEFGLYVDDPSKKLTSLGAAFYLRNIFPANWDYYASFDWIYRAYSLYGGPVTKGPLPQAIVIYSRDYTVDWQSYSPLETVTTAQSGEVMGRLLKAKPSL